MLLLVHERLAPDAGLEVDGHALVDERQERQDVVAPSVSGQFLDQRLDEPRPMAGVAPRIETFSKELESSNASQERPITKGT